MGSADGQLLHPPTDAGEPCCGDDGEISREDQPVGAEGAGGRVRRQQPRQRVVAVSAVSALQARHQSEVPVGRLRDGRAPSKLPTGNC